MRRLLRACITACSSLMLNTCHQRLTFSTRSKLVPLNVVFIVTDQLSREATVQDYSEDAGHAGGLAG